MEFLLMVIPLATIAFLYWKFAKKIAWWETTILVVAPFVLIISSKALVEYSQVSDTERWGGYITVIQHTTEWDEYIHQTCSSICCCDSKGNNCSTTTYDCSYVETHPERADAWDSNGVHWEIPPNYFNKLAIQFENGPTHLEHIRGYSKDGDKYQAVMNWNGEWFPRLEPTTVEHTYENRVQASTSIYNFPAVNIKKDKLFEYPVIFADFKEQPILGGGNPNEQKYYAQLNGILGGKKQCRLYVCLFNADQDRSIAYKQKCAWKGGNKNELVVCIGIDDSYRVQWCEPFSWSETNIDNDVRHLVEEQGQLELIPLADKLDDLIEREWVRKRFQHNTDGSIGGFARLAVTPPTWTIVLNFFLVLGLCGGWGYFSATNEYDKCGVVTHYRRFLQ